MEKVRFATNLATKRESGVMRITTNAIFQSISSINTRVPAMVISCEELCESHEKPVCKLVHIGNDAADRLAGGVPV